MLSKKPRANQCFRKFVHFGVAAQPTRTVPKPNSSNRRDTGRGLSVGGPLTMNPRSVSSLHSVLPRLKLEIPGFSRFSLSGLSYDRPIRNRGAGRENRRGPHGAGLEIPVKYSWVYGFPERPPPPRLPPELPPRLPPNDPPRLPPKLPPRLMEDREEPPRYEFDEREDDVFLTLDLEERVGDVFFTLERVGELR